MKTQIKIDGQWVDGIPNENEWCNIEVLPGVWQQQRWITQTLDQVKSIRKTGVKQEAYRRIKEAEGEGRWKVHKAERKSRRGSNAEITALDDFIETITIDSDEAEIAIDSLITINDVEEFTW